VIGVFRISTPTHRSNGLGFSHLHLPTPRFDGLGFVHLCLPARRFDRVGFLQRLHIINAGSTILVNDVGGAFS